MSEFLFDEAALVDFLVRAKAATYASDSAEFVVAPLVPGTHQLDYTEGPFLYRDLYAGGLHFAGQETVYHDGVPVWSMVYAGGMLDESVPLGGVLKAALRQVTADAPYRGPVEYRESDYVYTDTCNGEVTRFWGMEMITFQGRPIYDLRYQGGIIR
ncbi:MAG: hypothetical protein JW910_19525 [Anaerolineae bacterium]|nr:hypothetical protein [Anaerolineae bacterium]